MSTCPERDEEVMAQVCECGRKWGEHSFTEFMLCQYQGTPLKRGGVFTEKTAKAIVKSITDGK